jgi:hypothetical protein
MQLSCVSKKKKVIRVPFSIEKIQKMTNGIMEVNSENSSEASRE